MTPVGSLIHCVTSGKCISLSGPVSLLLRCSLRCNSFQRVAEPCTWLQQAQMDAGFFIFPGLWGTWRALPSGPSVFPDRSVSSPLEPTAGARAPIANLCQEAPIHSPSHFLLSFVSTLAPMENLQLKCASCPTTVPGSATRIPCGTKDPCLRTLTPAGAKKVRPMGWAVCGAPGRADCFSQPFRCPVG